MKTRLSWALLSGCLAALAHGGGSPLVSRDVRQHLDIAVRCSASGDVESALAHIAVVAPDRALRVRADFSNLPPAQQGLYRNALSGAFHLWEDALGQPIFAESETVNPDVTVRFTPDVNDRGVEVCGHSEWVRGVATQRGEPVTVLRAEVQVRMVWPGGNLLNFEQLQACAAHELGHVLGLEDSRIAGDVMGPMNFNRPALAVKPGEVADLLDMRAQARQIRASLLLRSIKQRQ